MVPIDRRFPKPHRCITTPSVTGVPVTYCPEKMMIASPAEAAIAEQDSAPLPCGYDHKYVYSHIGYNLKATDMQAAVGYAQLHRELDQFIVRRKENFRKLTQILKPCEDRLILPRIHEELRSLPGSAMSINGESIRPVLPATT